jgi:hypothetical protein
MVLMVHVHHCMGRVIHRRKAGELRLRANWLRATARRGLLAPLDGDPYSPLTAGCNWGAAQGRAMLGRPITHMLQIFLVRLSVFFLFLFLSLSVSARFFFIRFSFSTFSGDFS